MEGQLDELQKDILSPNIRILGEILGEVLRDQAGEDLFEIEEKARLLSKKFREEGDLAAFAQLQEVLKQCTPEDQSIIIKAFSHFFQLANLAEEYYKIRVQKIKDQTKTTTSTIEYALSEIKQYGLNPAEFKDLLNELKIQLVWTSHPTEARRLTVMMKLRRIFDLISKLQLFYPDEYDHIRTREEIKEEVTALWQSDELREDKVTLLDEVRTVLFYFDQTVFAIVPQVYRKLHHQLKLSGYQPGSVISLPRIIEFGSWTGGDRDGHPGVTADITFQTLLLHKRLCLRRYHRSVEELIQHLSTSSNRYPLSHELVQSIERDAEAFPGFSTATSKLNVLEPYRRKLDFMRLKLENALASVDQSAIEVGLGQTLVGATNTMYTAEISTTFARSNEFLDELMILYRSLESNGGKVLAEGKLADLINQVRVFGFHLAPLDLRQDADVHIAALADIFKTIGLEDLTTMTKEEQCEVFLRELLNPRPLGISAILSQLQPQSQEVFRTLQVGADSIQNISPRSISTYIISMSTHERDVLALMLLMNEVGLIEISDGRVTRAYMDIAPLFETKEDLEHAAEVMHRLDNMDLYQSYLDLRGNVQEIMVGYSDSTKDVGILESNYRLILAQQELERVTREHNSVVRIFHGRGGSVSRGGGPTNQAILALPPNTTRHVKITEQGEVIGQSYANPQIALTHLEGIISAMIIRGVQDRRTEIEDNPTFMDAASQKILSGLASISRETYEAMVKRNKDFIPFYLQFTPLDLIERATIGSRPSRRTKDNVSSISALRAIPWIFSFTQTRLIFPGYFGLGTALKAFDEAGDFGKLQELYRSLPYFETMISNIQMVMLKADMNIAELYLDLLEDGNREIFTRIREEFELTREYIIRLSQTDDLLGIAPDIRNSIRRRNPYLDPLSILQVALLKEWRKNGRPEDMGPMSLQRLLLQTVNGIAAGLKNTG